MVHSLRFLLFAAGLVAFAACRSSPSTESAGTSAPQATNPAYERLLGAWVDKPEEALVTAWGVPERSQPLTDGGQVLEYQRRDSAGALLCTTIFTTDVYGAVRTWSYRGTDCRSPQLGDNRTKS